MFSKTSGSLSISALENERVHLLRVFSIKSETQKACPLLPTRSQNVSKSISCAGIVVNLLLMVVNSFGFVS